MRLIHGALELLFVAAFVTLTLTVTALGAEPGPQPPSCEVVRQRLSQAARVLRLRIPPLSPHRERPDTLLVAGENTWTTPNWPPYPGENYSFGGTEIYCRSGEFSQIFVAIEDSDHPIHPTFDLIAAAIYAFTGWPADKTIDFTDKVLKNRPALDSIAPDDVKVEEISGANVKLMKATFAIELLERAERLPLGRD